MWGQVGLLAEKSTDGMCIPPITRAQSGIQQYSPKRTPLTAIMAVYCLVRSDQVRSKHYSILAQ